MQVSNQFLRETSNRQLLEGNQLDIQSSQEIPRAGSQDAFLGPGRTSSYGPTLEVPRGRRS